METREKVQLVAVHVIRLSDGTMRMTGETDRDGNPIFRPVSWDARPGSLFEIDLETAEGLLAHGAAARPGTPAAEQAIFRAQMEAGGQAGRGRR